MSLIIGENVSHQYGAQEVLKHVGFRVEENDRVGLVGPNGEGKTTLLRIVAGTLEATLGSVHRRRELSIGYLPQEPPALQATTIRQAMRDAAGELIAMEQQLQELAAQMAESQASGSRLQASGTAEEAEKTSDTAADAASSPPPSGEGRERERATDSRIPDAAPSSASSPASPVVPEARSLKPEAASLLHNYGELQAAFEAKGGYTLNMRIDHVLTGLGFDETLRDRPLAELSGGQRTRAYLATLLLREPELLLLDEPTNHLDLESVEWLEGWLQGFEGAIVVVSHDRYFLDRVTTATWEVASKHVERYRGSYSHYVRQRAERITERMRIWQQQQEYIAKTEEFIRIHIAGQRTKEAQGRRKRLERFMRDEAIERPRDFDTIHLRLPGASRTGQIVFRARELTVGYDPSAPVLEVPELEAQLGDRVAIIGPNGSGKTTLLKTLLGELDPLAGEVFRGAKVSVGYLSQTHAELDPEMTAVEAVRQIDRSTTPEQARTLLGSLLLSGDDADKRIAQLSGGQRSRVILARLVVQKANVLVLDEPTNHLDIPSTEILQDALAHFDGTVLFVSHDRYLIQQIASVIWTIERQAGGTEGPEERRGTAKETEETRDTAAGAVLSPPPSEGEGQGEGDVVSSSPAVPEARSLKSEAAVPPPNILRRTIGGWEGYLIWRRDHSPSAEVDREAEARRAARREDHRDARRRANELIRLRRRHERIETEIASLEEELKSIEARMSDASIAGNLDRVHDLSDEYLHKNARLKQLWEEWEQVGGKLE